MISDSDCESRGSITFREYFPKRIIAGLPTDVVSISQDRAWWGDGLVYRISIAVSLPLITIHSDVSTFTDGYTNTFSVECWTRYIMFLFIAKSRYTGDSELRSLNRKLTWNPDIYIAIKIEGTDVFKLN